ncbi:MAG TPA: MBL fold metallo-hydrolase [Ktedonobacteraceae bacterium]|jgi:glyoxylase-like metal-dependent hydrolase (beta-lactamase superfamily II)|nr:MBL fold metallo-hydrolase [Ktedonobacteraceae bacterium]
MKTQAVSNHLFQLTHLGLVNCFLVREEDGFTLVDTSWPSSQAQVIAREAGKLGLPIVRIVLTHAHIDHVGSLDALHELLPDVPVAIGQREARLLAGDLSLDPTEPRGEKAPGAYPCKTKPAQLLDEGERIGSLEAVFTPGHSLGHLAFLDIRDRALIAGDALQTLGGVAVSGTIMPLFPLPAMSNWSKEQSLVSARKLLALQPSLLTVGHGRMLSQPQEAMARAIQVLERDLLKAHGAQGKVA